MSIFLWLQIRKAEHKIIIFFRFEPYVKRETVQIVEADAIQQVGMNWNQLPRQILLA